MSKFRVTKFLNASLLSGAAILALSSAVQAQTSDDEETIVVTGSRLPADVRTVPGTVTIVSEETLAQQSAISSDLGRILQSAVPGMSLSAGDGNNFSQTLRGRKPAFFIDGIPQSAELRGGGRDMRIVHPSVLERVEVINGATSIYGLGGSGGVVNYITKRPKEDGLKYFSEVSVGGALSHVSSEGMEYGVVQSIAGGYGNVDVLASVSFNSRGLFYDGDGDPIPPDPTGQTGIADTDELTLFAKIGVDISSRTRFEVMALRYDAQVDTDYTVGQGSFAAGIKSIAVPKQKNNFNVMGILFDFVGEDPFNRNTLFAASLAVDDVYGSKVKLTGYYKESEQLWRFISFLAPFPTQGGFPPTGSQLQTDSERMGLRLDIVTPFSFDNVSGSLLWGLEYGQEATHEQLTDGRDRTSRMVQDNYAAFVQAQVDIGDSLHLRGGVRFDRFDLDVPSFRTLDFFSAAVLHNVVGTKLSFEKPTFNFGAVYDVTEELSIFAAYSQGFSIGNVARTISGLRPNTPGPAVTYYVDALGKFTEAVTVNAYEGGVRYDSEVFSGSLTGFLNTSKLGATFDPVTLATLRAPERIWGVEAAFEVNLDPVKFGAAYTWLDSEQDANNDGTYERQLDFSRVPPAVLRAFVEADFAEGWNARIQATHLFSESRFNAPFGQLQRDVEAYTIFDAYVSTKALPYGTLSLGVENLFNKQYYPMSTLLNCSDNVLFNAFCGTTASGARATLRYSVDY